MTEPPFAHRRICALCGRPFAIGLTIIYRTARIFGGAVVRAARAAAGSSGRGAIATGDVEKLLDAPPFGLAQRGDLPSAIAAIPDAPEVGKTFPSGRRP
jgi:hypothetical protein